MKIRPTVLLVVSAAALVVALAGCSFLGVSIEQRIDIFVSSLNTATRADTGANFSSSAAYYSAIQDGSWWGGGTTGHFPTEDMAVTPYSVESGFATEDPLNVQIIISGPLIFGGPKDYKLVMVNEASPEEAPLWRIRELWIWVWNDTLPTPAWEWQAVVQ